MLFIMSFVIVGYQLMSGSISKVLPKKSLAVQGEPCCTGTTKTWQQQQTRQFNICHTIIILTFAERICEFLAGVPRRNQVSLSYFLKQIMFITDDH